MKADEIILEVSGEQVLRSRRLDKNGQQEDVPNLLADAIEAFVEEFKDGGKPLEIRQALGKFQLRVELADKGAAQSLWARLRP